jgi:transcriptional regulator with XRE-family HTH domain
MSQKPLESLGALVRSKRGQRKLRDVAREIEIGAATLLRIESGRIPDVVTFGKICKWLEVYPAAFLGTGRRSGSYLKRASENSIVLEFSAHLKADQVPKLETVKALAQMLLLAARTQYRPPES